MRIQLPVRAGVAAVCVAGAVASFIGYRSEQRVEESFLSVVEGKSTAETFDILESSGTLNPDTRRYTGKASFLVDLGRRAEAEETMREAARREPENASVWLNWARIRLRLRRPEAAREAYARAKELDSQLPRTPLPQ